jgi:hypothetical protein
MKAVKAPWVRPWVLGALVCGASWLNARRAEAAPSDAERARATELFHEGRASMAAQRYAEACGMLEESQRLDPGGGTLLNLALCHELEGRTATASSEFQEALEVARRDGRPDRETEASRHLQALAPRVARVAIYVPLEARTADLIVRRDGAAIVAANWGAAVPLDPGEHVVEAEAPGRTPWRTTIAVRDDGAVQTVRVPALEPLPPTPPLPAPPSVPQPALPAIQDEAPSPAAQGEALPPAIQPAAPPRVVEGEALPAAVQLKPPSPAVTGETPPPPGPRRGASGAWQRPAAIGVGAAGVAGLGIGAAFGFRAASQWSDARPFCGGGVCTTSQAYTSWQDSRSSASIATAALVAGGLAVAGGVVLWLTAPAAPAGQLRVSATLAGVSASAEF